MSSDLNSLSLKDVGSLIDNILSSSNIFSKEESDSSVDTFETEELTEPEAEELTEPEAEELCCEKKIQVETQNLEKNIQVDNTNKEMESMKEQMKMMQHQMKAMTKKLENYKYLNDYMLEIDNRLVECEYKPVIVLEIENTTNHTQQQIKKEFEIETTHQKIIGDFDYEPIDFPEFIDEDYEKERFYQCYQE